MEKIKFESDKMLNGVKLTFDSASNAGIQPAFHLYLNKLISVQLKDINEDKYYTLFSLHVSSTSEPYHAHKVGGPHRNGLAIDFSAVNGNSISKFYGIDQNLTGICDALQYRALDLPETFDNFGPLMCFKTLTDQKIYPIRTNSTGNIELINQHKTHLHFSIRA